VQRHLPADADERFGSVRRFAGMMIPAAIKFVFSLGSGPATSAPARGKFPWSGPDGVYGFIPRVTPRA
jgi:hypothetical protein